MLLTRLRGLWRRIEPGLQIDRDNLIERWDCTGEGRATCVSFEGFGITFSLFIGRTPRFAPHEASDRTNQLIRWYAGEAQA
ncbi:hypothetical protein [Sphingomonas sp. GM_Shp_2]|uniref:hypothetical protein n=1 Tax=Sphingomonas sp. GM_Shp_2 TaxID=2937380 RepID=UPI00226ACE86|nr:hypothetical protein [Sphingomonas sp. GM_Shp_2]